MSEQSAGTPATDSEDEAKLRRFVEQVTGGRVTAMERQVRWRPAWFVDVQRGEETLHIHLRGDRKSDILPFPELQREADILTVLEEHGIPVPHIYGVCQDPPAIVMTAVPGTRDVSKAASDEERQSVARQYMDAMAAVHRLPLEPFVEKGIHLPVGAEEIALEGLNAYLPVYHRNKKKPEPLLEFAIRWLRTNVPAHRTKPAFTLFDAGQFLFENGKITALYDLEFSMISDPIVDLATMRMRDSYEPTGDEMRNLYRYYESIMDEPLDIPALHYYTVLFSTAGCMQIAGTVASPIPGNPHDVYLEWDLALRRTLVNALADALEITLAPQPTPAVRPGPDAMLAEMLKDTLAHLATPDPMQQARKESALNLVECLARSEAMGDELHRQTWNEAVAILGHEPAGWAAMDAELERFVQTAEPARDRELLRFFASQAERRVMVYGSTGIGRSAANVALPPPR